MAASEVETQPPGLPDYVLDANAVLKDQSAAWRYGGAPDYSNTRRVYEETRTKHHEAGSLPDLVEKLVKNWEIEASFKTNIADWRTIDHANYTFAINGGPPQSGEHMLKVGTYNAIINKSNDFYSPEHIDLAGSHKTFKRMMPTFAWEVLEVYSGPPKVAFRWRHWGTMKDDYVGFNGKGEKVTAKAHGGPIDIQGVTVALLNDKLQVQTLETWFDPLEMFRQIAPNGIVSKEKTEAVNEELAEPAPVENPSATKDGIASTLFKATAELKAVAAAFSKATQQLSNVAAGLSGSPGEPRDEQRKEGPGEAVVPPAESKGTALAHNEMSTTTATECPFLINKD